MTAALRPEHLGADDPALRIDVFTIFPEMVDQFCDASLLGRARREGVLEVNSHDLRKRPPMPTARSTTHRSAAEPAWS